MVEELSDRNRPLDVWIRRQVFAHGIIQRKQTVFAQVQYQRRHDEFPGAGHVKQHVRGDGPTWIRFATHSQPGAIRSCCSFMASSPFLFIIVKYLGRSFRDKGIDVVFLTDRDDSIHGFLQFPETAILHLGSQQRQGA